MSKLYPEKNHALREVATCGGLRLCRFLGTNDFSFSISYGRRDMNWRLHSDGTELLNTSAALNLRDKHKRSYRWAQTAIKLHLMQRPTLPSLGSGNVIDRAA